MAVISPGELRTLIATALTANRVSPGNAESVARALVLAEMDGKKGHGLSRVPSYAGQAQSGKVDGFAEPVAAIPRPGTIAIDAKHGFAYPAIDLLASRLPDMARENGIALAGISHSHHHGVAGHHAERLADGGLVALVFGNSPAAIAPWGGKTPLFGTNPIGFAAPMAAASEAPQGQASASHKKTMKNRPPLVIDFAASKIARGNLLVAKQKGEAIPEGWALDKHGQPTTDAEAGLAGSMVAIAEAKGAAMALMVEVLAAALTGAAFGNESNSLFTADGAPPNLGQTVIAIDPTALTGDMATRLAAFARLIESDGDARLPGSSRHALRDAAEKDGLKVDDTALEAARKLASGG